MTKMEPNSPKTLGIYDLGPQICHRLIPRGNRRSSEQLVFLDESDHYQYSQSLGGSPPIHELSHFTIGKQRTAHFYPFFRIDLQEFNRRGADRSATD